VSRLAIIAAFVVLIGGMVGYNAYATEHERPTALVVDVTARQRTLTERYIKDTVLALGGVQADPSSSATVLRETATALLEGGKVVTTTGQPRPAGRDPRANRQRGTGEAAARAIADHEAARDGRGVACRRTGESELRR